MDWLEICVTVENEALAEAATNVLQPFAIGDEGVAVEQLGDPNDVSPHAMLAETLVKLYVDGRRDSAEFRQKITQTITDHNLPSPTFTPIYDKDWANAWKEHYRPLRIGQRFWIQPSWLSAEDTSPNDIVLTLDPGMAFGTGTHETTQLCLAALEEYLPQQAHLLDLGTGSGILAIGAAHLNTASILAVDTDPHSIEATAQNAANNQVADQIEVRLGSLDQVQEKEWDIVVANILAPILDEMLREQALLSYVKAGGFLILSGILGVQSAEIQTTIHQAGGRIIRTDTQGDWVAIIVQPI